MVWSGFLFERELGRMNFGWPWRMSPIFLERSDEKGDNPNRQERRIVLL